MVNFPASSLHHIEKGYLFKMQPSFHASILVICVTVWTLGIVYKAKYKDLILNKWKNVVLSWGGWSYKKKIKKAQSLLPILSIATLCKQCASGQDVRPIFRCAAGNDLKSRQRTSLVLKDSQALTESVIYFSISGNGIKVEAGNYLCPLRPWKMFEPKIWASRFGEILGELSAEVLKGQQGTYWQSPRCGNACWTSTLNANSLCCTPHHHPTLHQNTDLMFSPNRANYFWTNLFPHISTITNSASITLLPCWVSTNMRWLSKQLIQIAILYG